MKELNELIMGYLLNELLPVVAIHELIELLYQLRLEMLQIQSLLLVCNIIKCVQSVLDLLV